MSFIARSLTFILFGLVSTTMPSVVQAQAQPRHYDCSKPGNANKTVCKSQTATVPVAAAPVTKASVERHYDCSKAGNANKAVCKSAAPAPATPSVAASNPTASSHSAAPAPTPTAMPADGKATAKCKDGSLSYSAHRSGTCSHHGGVASWM